MKKPDYRWLDIWYVRLDPTEGNEARKTRPCLVLQNDIGNKFSDVTMIVPFLEPKPYPFVVIVEPTPQNGLDRSRGLNFSQMRVAYHSRFVNKLGVLEKSYIPAIEKAIKIELNLFHK